MNDPFVNAWVAGFFDGEGSLSILLLKPKPTTISVRIVAQCSQQGRESLDILLRNYGGFVGQYSNGKHKAYWKWTLAGKPRLIPFLNAIKPFAIVKRPQIEIALKCMALQRPVAWNQHGQQFYSADTLAEFHRLRYAMQALNANS